ncbi:metal-dependent transcriptional regulator [Streptococcaceae bacterium ESL0687]|nr:metal-dependent transcriptional regulator [Streptococcaceae bacterium ESL0687]
MKKHVNNANQEDYLKVMYQNGGLHSHVSNKVLSQKLKVSPPSVSEMLLKLAEKDYISYTPYKGAILTEKGAEDTARIIRNHRIFERFLYDKLGYSLREVHNLAEELEHVKDPDFFHRLYDFLGHPTTCPHGSLINKDRVIYEEYTESLADFDNGDRLLIKRFDDSNSLLEFVEENHLKLNQEIDLVKEDDRIMIESKASRLLLSDDFAHKIYAIKDAKKQD